MHQPRIPHVARTDPEIASLIEQKARREFEKIRLIPSENYVSVAVLEASGSVLTNKYSEGQQFIDVIETMAVQRAQALFGVEHANVQPYSGSPANLAVYLAFAEPGDTIMGMSLPMGGGRGGPALDRPRGPRPARCVPHARLDHRLTPFCLTIWKKFYPRGLRRSPVGEADAGVSVQVRPYRSSGARSMASRRAAVGARPVC